MSADRAAGGAAVTAISAFCQCRVRRWSGRRRAARVLSATAGRLGGAVHQAASGPSSGSSRRPAAERPADAFPGVPVTARSVVRPAYRPPRRPMKDEEYPS